jgi:hypothetical protein
MEPLLPRFAGLSRRDGLGLLRGLTVEELVALRDECGGSASLVGRATGVSDRRARQCYWEKGIKGKAKKEEEPTPDGIREKYFEKRAEKLERENEKLRDWRQLIAETVMDASLSFKPLSPPKLRTRKSTDRDECLGDALVSDCHVGLGVTADSTAGLNVYNFDAFLERCDAWKAHLKSVTEEWRDGFPMPNLLLPIIGDVASSENVFPRHLAANQLLLNDQIVKAAWYIGDLIRYAASLYENILVVTTPGNHAPHSAEITFSSDQMIYVLMRELLKEQTNVTFRISGGDYLGLCIEPGNPLLNFGDVPDPIWLMHTHGHAARFYQSLPYYSLDRLTMKLNLMCRTNWDLVCVGHSHQPAQAGNWLCNGCWSGGDDFSVNKLQSSAWPSQTFFALHPRYIVKQICRLYLTERPSISAPDSVGVVTPVTEELGQ